MWCINQFVRDVVMTHFTQRKARDREKKSPTVNEERSCFPRYLKRLLKIEPQCQRLRKAEHDKMEEVAAVQEEEEEEGYNPL